MTSDIRLTIALGAIAANWKTLARLAAPAECAGVVKANGYGLGIERVAPTLWAAGCRSFFVAHFAEGMTLRDLLPDATIYILNGFPPGEEAGALAAGLVPVVNGLEDLARVIAAHPRPALRASAGGRPLSREGEENIIPIALHVDTGIHRLGLTDAELDRLTREPALLDGICVQLLMSHLVTSETPEHPLNALQQKRFAAITAQIAAERASLANSSGIFLGKDFHFDLVRTGVALFGANPTPGQANPMRNVVTLEARVLKVQDVLPGDSVGYGAAFVASRPSRIATLSIGYADGLPRRLGNRGQVFVAGQIAPIVGRVSMDTTTIDITDVAADARPGSFVELIGPNRPIEEVAAEAETIAYEILTGLGSRASRVYVNGATDSESIP